MITKTILALCLFAVFSSLAIGFAGGAWSLMSPEDVLIFPMVAGPYAVIAFLAWWWRSRNWESILVLGTVLLMAIYGLWAVCLSVYRHNNPVGEMAMDLTPVVVPVLQGIVALLLAAVLGAIAGFRSLAAKR